MSIEDGLLYVVATPIGNLDDISYRAVETLREVALVAAEDTRHSAALMRHYSITTPMLSLHEHNERERIDRLMDRLEAGQSIALISDAGTPLLSDPGFVLVRAARERGLRVSPIPGPSALIAAASVAGIPVDHFVFEGFLPAKQGMRKKRLEEIKGEQRTLIFYESSHRILDCLADMVDVFGAEREATVAREMTKLYETITKNALGELLQQTSVEPDARRGEFVLLVAGAKADAQSEQEAQRIFHLLMDELPLKQAAKLAAAITGKRKNELYRSGLAER